MYYYLYSTVYACIFISDLPDMYCYSLTCAKQEGEYDMVVSDLQDKLRFRDKVIMELKDERADLQTQHTEMSRQLQEKDKEISQVRSDAKRTLRLLIQVTLT